MIEDKTKNKKKQKVTKEEKTTIITEQKVELKNSPQVEKVIKKTRDLNEEVKVTNITNSSLTYISKSQVGYRVDWGEYGEENWMEYKELLNMRNSQRAFFEQPWIMCDWDVLEDLKVDKYYKDIINLDNIEDIFSKTPDDLKNTLEIVPRGIKELIVDKAFELIKSKKLDSIKIIEVIEKTLEVDLTV